MRCLLIVIFFFEFILALGQTNLLINGDFTLNLNSWTTSGNVLYENIYGYDGAIFSRGDLPVTGVISQNITLCNIDSPLTMSATYTRDGNNLANCQARLEIIDNNTNIIIFSTILSAPSVGSLTISTLSIIPTSLNLQIKITDITLNTTWIDFYLTEISVMQGGCPPLPIELLNFNVQLITNDMVKATWQTLTEINSDYFVLEKSYDKVNWVIVDTIQGNDNSNELLSYELWDRNPGYGRVHYRLKQVDIDGNYRYYKVSYLDIEESKVVSFYPNPAADKILFNKNLERILLYNTNGCLINITDYQNFIDISYLPDGLYMIKILDNGIVKCAKFYKIK